MIRCARSDVCRAVGLRDELVVLDLAQIVGVSLMGQVTGDVIVHGFRTPSAVAGPRSGTCIVIAGAARIVWRSRYLWQRGFAMARGSGGLIEVVDERGCVGQGLAPLTIAWREQRG
jgi:hypothetical protein